MPKHRRPMPPPTAPTPRGTVWNCVCTILENSTDPIADIASLRTDVAEWAPECLDVIPTWERGGWQFFTRRPPDAPDA